MVLIILVMLLSGCLARQGDKTTFDELARIKCIELCEAAKKTTDLSNGPCLSDNNLDWGVKDWVCDVAHWPREDVDNKPENQCQEFRSGKAHHFIEVDTNCNFIRAY